MIIRSHTILFVDDQQRATEFFQAVLEIEPTLNVKGMTEFTLSDTLVLGLMPVAGAERLLDSTLSEHRDSGELYVLVDDAARYHDRALSAGATEISPLQLRDWGAIAAYSRTPDGHILAFADEEPDDIIDRPTSILDTEVP